MCMLWQAFDKQSLQQPYEGTWERQSLPRLHLANWQRSKSLYSWPYRVIKWPVFGTENPNPEPDLNQTCSGPSNFILKLEREETECGATAKWYQERPHLHFMIGVLCNLLQPIKVFYSCKDRFFLPLKFVAGCSKLQRRLVWSSVF